jgi:hypothetical protein
VRAWTSPTPRARAPGSGRTSPAVRSWTPERWPVDGKGKGKGEAAITNQVYTLAYKILPSRGLPHLHFEYVNPSVKATMSKCVCDPWSTFGRAFLRPSILPLIHPIINSSALSVVRQSGCSYFVRPLICSFVRSFVTSFVRSFVRSLDRSLFRAFAPFVGRSFVKYKCCLQRKDAIV